MTDRRRIVTPQQRQEWRERKAKAKEKPAKNYYQLEKYKALRYKYSLIDDEAQREQMQEAALKIRQCERRAVQDLITIGQELIAIKALLPDKFTEWIGEEFGYSNGSAHDFMNMAKRHGQFPNFGNLGISSARLLSPPSVPDEAIEDALDKTEAKGTPITLAETKHILALHKPPKPPKPKQLTGPTPEEEVIDAEYSVIAEPVPPATLTFAEWWDMMPHEEMGLGHWLLIFKTAQAGVGYVRTLDASLTKSVLDIVVPWSKFIHTIEKATPSWRGVDEEATEE